MAGVKIDPAVDRGRQPIWTGTWRDTRFGPHDGGRPENALIGSIWTVNCWHARDHRAGSKAGLRIWRNTPVADLTSGSRRWERDPRLRMGRGAGKRLPAGRPRPPVVNDGSNQEKIQGFGTSVAPGTATHSLTLYRHNSGALVFGASTVQWSWGLDASTTTARQRRRPGDATGHGQSVRRHGCTTRFLAGRWRSQQPATGRRYRVEDSEAPTTSITSPLAGANVENGSTVTITGTATEGRRQVAGVEVSTDGGTTWRAAEGTSNWSYLWTPGAIGSATIRARAIDDSGNLGFDGPSSRSRSWSRSAHARACGGRQSFPATPARATPTRTSSV